MSTSKQAPNITSLTVKEPDLLVALDDGQTLTVPLKKFSRLTGASSRQLRAWRLIGGGDGVHWDELDEDISVRAFLREGARSAELSTGSVAAIGRSVPAHRMVRDLLVDLVADRESVVALACRTRAKFEQWLQFELADRLQDRCSRVLVERQAATQRTDIAFSLEGSQYNLELRTPNTSWSLPGVTQATRPITGNIQGIVTDALKLRSRPGTGLVAFVLFPVPSADKRWVAYLQRVCAAARVRIEEEEHCTTVAVSLGRGLTCDAVVCVFPVDPE